MSLEDKVKVMETSIENIKIRKGKIIFLLKQLIKETEDEAALEESKKIAKNA